MTVVSKNQDIIVITCYALLPFCDIWRLKYEFSAINLLGSACFSVICYLCWVHKLHKLTKAVVPCSST